MTIHEALYVLEHQHEYDTATVLWALEIVSTQQPTKQEDDS